MAIHQTQSIMENQATINAIGTLSGTIDALTRAGDKEAIRVVTEKILELIKKL
mgnify:CR=1 FL=1